MARLQFQGRFYWERWTQGGVLVASGEFPNAPTNQGLTDLLTTYFRNGPARPAWYIGLISSTGFTALAAGDTMASHTGWTEATTYTEATRPAWNPAAPANNAISNPTLVRFTTNAITALRGLFVTSDQTKGGTTGILWATGQFGSAVTVPSGEVFKVFYSLTASGS